MWKRDFAWFEEFIAQANAENERQSGGAPAYRKVTPRLARSLNDDALEMAITAESPHWQEAKPVLLTERERRRRYRDKRTLWITLATLLAAVAAVAVPLLMRPSEARRPPHVGSHNR